MPGKNKNARAAATDPDTTQTRNTIIVHRIYRIVKMVKEE